MRKLIPFFLVVLISVFLFGCNQEIVVIPTEPVDTNGNTNEITSTPAPDTTDNQEETPVQYEIRVENENITVYVGDSGKIAAEVVPAAAHKVIKYADVTDVIKLNDDGSFTGVKEGSCRIKLYIDDEYETYVTVNVIPKPNPDAGLTLDKKEISVEREQTAVIVANYIPKYQGDDTALTYKSSDENVFKINAEGVITAVGVGHAVITVSNSDGSFTASCDVTVTAKIVDYPAKSVRHIFTHCLIAYPEMGCGDPAQGKGSLDIDCLTVTEFQRLLESLYENGFCLIDINDMYENYEDEEGNIKSRLKSYVKVPEGRKPLVISIDDVVYDSRKLHWGMIDRLEIKDGTIVGVKVIDGVEVYSNNEVFPQLELFIKEHPDFSYNGAKCTIALTGFEGILGYRTDSSFEKQGIDYMAEREKAQVVVDWLKNNGYNFACHSYSHADYKTCSQYIVNRDIKSWNENVLPLIGKTQIFIYPYGSETRYGTETHNKLLAQGFTVFCGTSATNCLWDGLHYNKEGNIVRNTGSIYLERFTITGQTLREWTKYANFYEYCDPYLIYDRENRYIKMPEKAENA